MAIEVVPRRTVLRLLSESGDGVFLLLRNGKDFLKINVLLMSDTGLWFKTKYGC